MAEAADDEEATPLKQKLDDFGEKLSYLIGIVCLLVWLMNFNNFWDEAHGSAIKGCIHYFKIAIALAVAAIPEGLPAVITTCLALGTRKMAANNAIVRRLPSVETLGCTTVICSDKTGTLTRNEMAAVFFGVWTDNKLGTRNSVAGDLSIFPVPEGKQTYCPSRGSGKEWETIDTQRAKFGAQYDALCVGCSFNNNSRLEEKDGAWTRVGEPTEAAMRVLAEKIQNKNGGAYGKELENKLSRVAQLDFTSKRKAMSVVVSGHTSSRGTKAISAGSDRDILLKGAPDRILAKCTKLLTPDGEKPLGSAERETISKQINDLSSRGLRVLAVAEILGAGKLAALTDANKTELLGDYNKFDEYEQGATFVGVVGIRDPPRPDVRRALEGCHTAGIRVIMITGDAVMTAVSIAKELSIVAQSAQVATCAVSGADFDKMSEKERLAAVERVNVFARVEPAHKRELVKCLIG